MILFVVTLSLSHTHIHTNSVSVAASNIGGGQSPNTTISKTTGLLSSFSNNHVTVI